MQKKFEMQCKFYTFYSLFQVEIYVNKEDVTEFRNSYADLFSIVLVSNASLRN